jgi:hypothetical protein
MGGQPRSQTSFEETVKANEVDPKRIREFCGIERMGTRK